MRKGSTRCHLKPLRWFNNSTESVCGWTRSQACACPSQRCRQHVCVRVWRLAVPVIASRDARSRNASWLPAPFAFLSSRQQLRMRRMNVLKREEAVRSINAETWLPTLSITMHDHSCYLDAPTGIKRHKCSYKKDNNSTSQIEILHSYVYICELCHKYQI